MAMLTISGGYFLTVFCFAFGIGFVVVLMDMLVVDWLYSFSSSVLRLREALNPSVVRQFVDVMMVVPFCFG